MKKYSLCLSQPYTKEFYFNLKTKILLMFSNKNFNNINVKRKLNRV